MKLWQKIYFFPLLLLVITLNLSGLLLIQNFHNSLLKKEVEACITEKDFLTYELKINNQNDRPFLNLEETINTLMTDYADSIHYEGTFQILDSGNKLLYTDFDFPLPPSYEELENLSIGQTHYIIRPLGGHYYLYIASLTDAYGIPLTIYYAEDISTIYEERQAHFNFFLKLDCFICFIFAIFMFLISLKITKPIRILTLSTQNIASGKYNERVLIDTKDEFRTLSNCFNQMAQTIEDKIVQLQLSNEQKEAFINNFTHELKTPLTSIIGYANFIRTSKYNEQLFLEASDYIYKESKNLEQIAFKMMDLIYAKSAHIIFQPEEVLSLYKEVKQSLQPKLDEKQIDLKIIGPPCILMIDKILMKILLCNLVENAIKASPIGSSIILAVHTHHQQTTLSVQDFGIGISPDHITKICDPFYVVDSARTKKSNGAGIGLSVCTEIAKCHNAALHIDSQLNEGTTISITFCAPDHLTTI